MAVRGIAPHLQLPRVRVSNLLVREERKIERGRARRERGRERKSDCKKTEETQRRRDGDRDRDTETHTAGFRDSERERRS